MLKPISEEAVRSIKDQTSLLKFLETDLDWPLPDNPAVDEATFEWTATELRLNESTQAKLKDGVVQQLRLSTESPWGIFLVNFNDGQMYKTALRGVLRALVPRRRRDSSLPSWKHENLLFICTTSNQEYSFAHFRGEKPERAKLVRFSWAPEEPIRTVCEYNLSALRMPERDLIGTDVRAWIDQWQSAFDVEKVTNEFFRQYRHIFENAEELIRGIKNKDEKRLFTQKMFNRLLFIRFLEKKDWLTINGRKDYLRALWEDYKKDAKRDSNFYRERLHRLFFLGLNAPNEVNQIGINRGGFLGKLIGQVPYLNGGLFEQDDDDKDDSISIPDKAIEPVLDELFYHFNFTVTESTPLDVDVAVDPEMLGRAFEELVTGRHETGSYYTPRSIVSFMCRESLKGYLGGWEKLVEERDPSDISVPQARELLSKMFGIRVIDPACGSGAYLLGMLHELHDLTRLLDTRTDKPSAKDDYERKLNIIQNNLFGVDNDPFATNIARLRLWLSLAVEYEGNDPPALPNLDFRIEVGDSLTAPDPQALQGLFRDVLVRHADRIASLKAKFLREHHETKKRLAKEIAAEEAALGKAVQDHPTEPNAFDWRIKFAEVFAHGGFDVVLANPPYGLKCKDPLRFQYFPRIKGEDPPSKGSYGLFMARALQLIKPGGFFTYIVSDTWRTIRTHRPLRKLLLTKTAVLHVLDLPSWIFNATVNTCIVSLRNDKASAEHCLIAGDLRNLPAGDWNTLEANLAAVAAHAIDVQTTTYARYTYPQVLIARNSNLPFFIGSPKLFTLMADDKDTPRERKPIGDKEKKTVDVRTVMMNGKAVEIVRFGDVADIKVGLQTGDNEYYIRKRERVRGGYEILDEDLVLSEREIEKLTNDEKQNGIDPKKHKGKHFLPYDKGGESDAEGGWLPNYYVPTGYFIDWSRSSVMRMKTLTVYDRDVYWDKSYYEHNYPNLQQRKDAIVKDKNAVASRFQNSDYYFRKGITFSRTGVYAPTFRIGAGTMFDTEGSTIFWDSSDVYSLNSLLSSKLVRIMLKNYVGHTVHTQVDDLKELSILMLHDNAKLAELVSQIVFKQRSDRYYPYHVHEQIEIDRLVYEMYGLNEEDIKEIELWYCRRYPLVAEAQGVLAEVKQKYAAHLVRCEMILSKPPAYWKSHPILQLVAHGEGANLEFKQTLEHNNRTNQRDAGVVIASLKAIAAFLNTDGGTLLIGVSDTGEVKGLERDYKLCNKHDKDGLEQKLRSLLSTRFNPVPLGNVNIGFEQLPEGEVCIVEAKPVGKSEVVHLDKKVYVRDGNVTRNLDGPELTRWAVRRGKE